MILLLSGTAFAQYGGGMGGGSTGPSYGHGKAIGIGIGAAAGGAGLLYLVLHHRDSVDGCISQANDRLSLSDRKTGETYTLLSSNADVKPGQRVEATGKRSKDAEGSPTFEVKKVRDLGACR